MTMDPHNQDSAEMTLGIPPHAYDDLDLPETIPCDCCLAERPLANFRLYDYWHLCQQCAADYESAYARNEVKSVSDFIGQYVLGAEFADDFQ